MKQKDLLFLMQILFIICLFIILSTRKFIEENTNSYPYITGFIKTAVLATTGEILTSRILIRNIFRK